jgi:hypothetical protein
LPCLPCFAGWRMGSAIPAPTPGYCSLEPLKSSERLHAGLESLRSGGRAPRAVLRPRCFVPRPGTAENCWGERGREFPSPPPPSRARPHADRPADSAQCGSGVCPTVSRPLRAAFLGLCVGGRPPELSGDAGTARTERRPLAVAHARCSRGVLHGTAGTMEHAWPSPLPEQALRGPDCAGRSAQGSLTEPWDEDCARPLVGGVVCQKRVPSGGGGPWPIWRQLEKCSLRSLGDAGQRSGHTRLVPTNPDRATWSCSPWVTRATHPKLS